MLGPSLGPTNQVKPKMWNVDQPYDSLGNLKVWEGLISLEDMSVPHYSFLFRETLIEISHESIFDIPQSEITRRYLSFTIKHLKRWDSLRIIRKLYQFRHFQYMPQRKDRKHKLDRKQGIYYSGVTRLIIKDAKLKSKILHTVLEL
jgi:hypothetical protein